MARKHREESTNEEFGINLSDHVSEFREKFFRQKEIDEIISFLKNGNNVLLVGKRGCGVDTIIRGIAKTTSKCYAPDFDIHLVTVNDFLIDTRHVGDLETRLKKIVDYFKTRNRRSIVFFPDIHFSLTAGASDTDPYGDLASRLSFLLAQRELQIIASTTPDLLKRIKRKNQAFLDNFAVREVAAMSEESTMAILKDFVRINGGDFADKIGDNLLLRICRKGERVCPLKTQPGASVNLLRNVLSNMTPSDGDGEQALSSSLSSITGIRQDFFDRYVKLSAKDVVTQIEHIFVGQSEALRKTASVLIRMRANLSPDYKPSGVMLFVGPTGVGKTELAKCIAKFLLGDKRKLKIYDMSEYSHAESLFSLIGHPQDSSHEALQRRGQLVDDALMDPYSIFLLDEIEKCHRSIIYLLLQVLGEGRLKDAAGESASFLNSIIIMTSNAGFIKPGVRLSEEEVLAALEETFPPEFINRIEHIIVFSHLTEEEKRGIALKEVNEALAREGISECGLKCRCDESLIDYIVQHGFNEKYNARGIQRAIEEFVIYPLADLLSSGRIVEGKLVISAKEGEVTFVHDAK